MSHKVLQPFARACTSCTKSLSTIAVYQSTRKSAFKYMLGGLIAGTSAVAYSYSKHKVSAATLFSGSNLDTSKWMTEPITDISTLGKNKESSMRAKIEILIMRIQGDVCKKLEELDGKQTFIVDKWNRAEGGGGGITCVMSEGNVFEKAGVNISVVEGELPAGAAQQMRSRGKKFKDDGKLKFFAAGISSVIHPQNPKIPTIHFNYRYFEVMESDGTKHWWFGGGTDLTPFFLDEDDCVHFHKTLKAACDKHNVKFYKRFKTWCDDYFFVKHRGERRGIGGIFFDDLDQQSPDDTLAFVTSCADAIIPAYAPIVSKHMYDKYSYDDRQWQLLRRGRYVEFNLVYDRGTKFGLLTPNARIESILMSLPTYAKWEYCHVPKEEGQKKLIDILKNPKEWV